MARVVVGHFRHRIDNVRAVGFVKARCIGARHDARFLAVDAHVVLGAVAKVAANEVLASGVVLAGIRFAFVYVLVTPFTKTNFLVID